MVTGWWFQVCFSPPARWGLLDFMSVAASSCLPPPAASCLVLLLLVLLVLLVVLVVLVQLRSAIHSVLCRTSTTTIPAQCSLPDLNHDHTRPVFPAGPQPRPSPPSVPCRTSTASIHAKCSLPDLNREYPRQVVPAGPHVGRSGTKRMPEDMPDKMPWDMPDRMPEGMPDKMPWDMPDRMPEGMPDRMAYKMSEKYVIYYLDGGVLVDLRRCGGLEDADWWLAIYACHADACPQTEESHLAGVHGASGGAFTQRPSYLLARTDWQVGSQSCFDAGAAAVLACLWCIASILTQCSAS